MITALVVPEVVVLALILTAERRRASLFVTVTLSASLAMHVAAG